MKTLLQVKNSYLEAMDEAKQIDLNADGGKRLIARYKKQIQFLNKVIIYLENNPTAEFLQGQLKTVQKQYKAIMSSWPAPPPGLGGDKNPEYKKKLMKWKKEHDVDKIKSQLRFINYILK